MTDAPGTARPSQMWKSLSSEQKQKAAEAFWTDGEAALEQAEATALIAQRIKFRAKSVMAMPVEKKAHYLSASPVVSELVAARLLVAYHLGHQRPMMGAFLDALGVQHEHGMIADEEMKAPSPETLKKGVDAIAAAYPADDVSLYLSTLLWQDPETWGGLADAPERRGAPAPAGGATAAHS